MCKIYRGKVEGKNKIMGWGRRLTMGKDKRGQRGRLRVGWLKEEEGRRLVRV